MSKSGRNDSSTNPQGDENLEIMRFAPRYTAHVGNLIAQHIPDDGGVLELGSGDGLQTSKIIPPQARFTCIEQSPFRQESLANLGYQVSEVLSVHIGSNSRMLFSLNCLEHIEDDLDVLRTIRKCLSEDGQVVLYVPALQFLFSNMDRHVGHYRRYTRKSLAKALAETGFRVRSYEYVDSIGVIASIIYKCIPTASGEPSHKSVALYDSFLFPASRFFDKFLSRLIGKNLLMIGDAV